MSVLSQENSLTWEKHMDSLQVMGNGYNTPWIPFSNLLDYDSFQDFAATQQGC